MQTYMLHPTSEAEPVRATPDNAGVNNDLAAPHGKHGSPVMKAGSGTKLQDTGSPTAKATLAAAIREWAKDPQALFYVVAGKHKRALIFPEDLHGRTDEQLTAYIVKLCSV